MLFWLLLLLWGRCGAASGLASSGATPPASSCPWRSHANDMVLKQEVFLLMVMGGEGLCFFSPSTPKTTQTQLMLAGHSRYISRRRFAN
jgi:hypothetical protein